MYNILLISVMIKYDTSRKIQILCVCKEIDTPTNTVIIDSFSQILRNHILLQQYYMERAVMVMIVW